MGFNLVENHLMKEGYCKYKGRWGNKVICRREENGFTSQLIFANYESNIRIYNYENWRNEK